MGTRFRTSVTVTHYGDDKLTIYRLYVLDNTGTKGAYHITTVHQYDSMYRRHKRWDEILDETEDDQVLAYLKAL